VLQIAQFPCLSDNYGFLVHDRASGETAAIDTPDADAYRAEADARDWRITQIWNTHWHPDHAGGNEALKAATGARVFGPTGERGRIPALDVGIAEGDILTLGSHRAQVIETPGHTVGHVVLYLAGDGVCFVGDTLFALGCGRLFEDSAERMWTSLSRLDALPGETVLYCAHEYTEANLRFALGVDADNPALVQRGAAIRERRAANQPTVPMTLEIERATNPFLRAPRLRQVLGLGPDTADWQAFAEMRRRKDAFR
jgi:hydroxyacylglutathione hydrolase